MLNKILSTLFGMLLFINVQSQEQHYNCFFELNSAEYNADSLVKLQAWLDSNPSSKEIVFDLIAYTDTIGSVEYNDQLAKNRLDYIVEFLKSEGYTTKNLRIVGKRYSMINYTNNADFRKVEIYYRPTIIKDKLVREEHDSSFEKKEREKKKKEEKSNEDKRKKTRIEQFEEIGDNKTINLSIEFQNNNNVYRNEESEKQVFYLAEYLKKYPNKKVMILGHVCCTDNYAVSNSRAKRVYNDLKKLKISKSRMNYKGMSNKTPLVQEIDEQTKQQNRRVEVVFYE